ncbi:unnamed protein product [Mytilus edulis]|uniref:Uncharacterized protein n=1 Tax=Mytilus edulis TaxID=6550 RepID=A0A8S3VJV3_MYTED|nr:unnamed protein product [Mytilus edulis]
MYKFGFRDPTCIPQEFMCDGHKDCFLGLDEKGCEPEESSAYLSSTIVQRTENTLTFPFESTTNSDVFNILTSITKSSIDPSVTAYQYKSKTVINNSSIQVSNNSLAHHHETTGSTNKSHLTAIIAVVVSIIAILCIGGSVYYYKRKYKTTLNAQSEYLTPMSLQDRPEQEDEIYESVNDVLVTRHENPTIVNIGMNKQKDVEKSRPDRDCNAFQKLRKSSSITYQDSGKECKLNANLAKQLHESSKYEISEMDLMIDSKSKRNSGDSLASKLYESIDDYNINSSSKTESTTYVEIE